MSAFLGPIHEKMYRRILYQDRMAQALLDLAVKNGWTGDLQEQADAEAPAASPGPLETLIDQSNIHGWLSEAVAGSERRFAFIAGKLLSGHPGRLGVLQDAMKELRRQSALSKALDAEQSFEAIHDILLDGMPCDFPFQMEETGPDTVAWNMGVCPHASHWPKESGAEPYYQLRDAWVEGALEGSGILHTRSGNRHTMQRGRG